MVVPTIAPYVPNALPMSIWTTAAPAVTTAFLSSLVEAVETLTIVLAVVSVRGWRPAAIGALAGLALLALIVLALRPLLSRFPLHGIRHQQVLRLRSIDGIAEAPAAQRSKAVLGPGAVLRVATAQAWRSPDELTRLGYTPKCPIDTGLAELGTPHAPVTLAAKSIRGCAEGEALSGAQMGPGRR